MIKGSRDTKVRISAGGQTYEYRTKEVRSKGETYSGIAVDGKSAGSMYAGKIDIISNDRGAGVNTKGELVSVDDVTITANGKITTEKVHSEKRVVYRTPKKVRIRKQVTAGDRVVVRAKKTEIDVDAEVITGYLKESLGEEAFEAEGEVEVNGKITAGGKISIEGGGKNSGEITATDRITVNGSTFDNTGGTVQSSSKIELNVQNTVNRGGYILSDGLTKEDMKDESLDSTQSGTVGNTNEFGVRIVGELDNRKGVIKGKEVTVGGAVSNSSGIIIGIEKAVLNGNLIINEEGTVKGREVEKVIQVGSLIDGGLSLESKGYEKQDLEDVDKSRTIGFNVTVYPNVSYSQRDSEGNKVYVNGSNPKETGMAFKTGITYADTDRTREILATVGAGVISNQDLTGVNREASKQVTDFEGREVRAIDVDLLTEYWATQAGRGKFRDIVSNSARSTQGIINVITNKSQSGEYDLLKNIVSENIAQRMERIGFIDVKGKKTEEIQKEVETRFGGLTKKGVKVRFYGSEDVDTSKLTKDELNQLMSDGFATTGDGYIWINKDRLTNDTIDLNKLIQHELTHQILGDNTEYQAQYVEGVYVNFLQSIKESGYLTDGEIVDLMKSSMTDGDRSRLNGYGFGDMQYKLFVTPEIADETIKYLEKMTDYKLIKKCSKTDCEIKIEKEGKNFVKKSTNNYLNGNKLIEKIITTREKVQFSMDDRQVSNSREVTYEGKKYYYINVSRTQSVNPLVWDKDKGIYQEEMPIYLIIAHELIHMLHYFDKTHINDLTGENWVYDPRFVKNPVRREGVDGFGDKEEYRTVGIGFTEAEVKKMYTDGWPATGKYNRAGDITENMIRKEQGLPLRIEYYKLSFVYPKD